MEMNPALTKQVAKLANLKLTEEEVRDFTGQLAKVIHYVEKLKELDVQGVQMLLHPLDLKTALREDVVQSSPVDSDGSPKVLASAPEVITGGFKVPPIL